MRGNLGSSMSRNFTDKSLLSRRGYSELINDDEDASLLCNFTQWWNDVRQFLVNAYEMGRSDPRQFIFAAKSGLAFAIISVLIFFKEPFEYISQHSIWAILTVIIVFEFSIGAILCKGFNIALGMFSAGLLALAIVQLSIWAGKWQEIIIVVSIFIAGSISNFVKLYPSMKPYDYGFRVFTFIFFVILVSGTSHFVETSVSRLLLIGVGVSVCLVVNIFVYPTWAGEDLHKLVVRNFRGVATSLEECVNNYLDFGYESIPSKILIYQASDDPLCSGYRSAVQSSSEEETLLGFAVWEPPHGRYKMLRYPWSHYVKVSGALRHCAFTVMGMHGCILAEIQASGELRNTFRNEIQKVSTEGARVLRELGSKVEKMEKLSPHIDLLEKVHEAAEELQMKIDRKSYLLVNSEKWAPARRQPKKIDDPEIVQEPIKEAEIKPNLFTKSLSEANVLNLNRNRNRNLNRKRPPLIPIKTLNRTVTNTPAGRPSMVHWGTSVDVLKNQPQQIPQQQWPSRLSIHGDTILNAREVKTHKSASALSLATFTSLLVEFVARLQNLVNTFVELSEKAKFSEPVNPLESKETVGCWTGVLKCIGIKD